MLTENTLVPELSVSDIKISLNFYLNILPFKMEYQRPEDKFAKLSLNGCQIMIEEINGYWQTGELSYPFGRGINFQIRVSDINELYKSLRKHKYPIKMDIQENWYRANAKWLGQKEFLVMDPDGYLLRFVQTLGERDKIEMNELK
ncbi:bleomycin resistance protein [Oceanobacillus chungangensis]|uniref:Bleomycin resistance protein n=1 Tax=Oceanobacillus chungangensis TaxID=1229152 RepID=A0A3D8PNR2_9BACI|nr:VOC family protein [Oceanobacillus chungangensis]RDW17292.1 aldoketomutase [Oceanobacillus chungangensis]